MIENPQHVGDIPCAKTSLFLDIEISKDEKKIHQIGAVFGNETLSITNIQTSADLVPLDEFAAHATATIGHNIIDHDLKIVSRHYPHLKILQLPVIDTLYLSPLAFPENPYHRLVKNYKLQKDSYNDPIADARLARNVFQDQWQSFLLRFTSLPQLCSLFRYCFYEKKGFVDLFDSFGVTISNSTQEIIDIFLSLTQDKTCVVSNQTIISQYLINPQKKMSIAYAVAWLQVAGGNSILPHWVRRRFPDVVTALNLMRTNPCTEKHCEYCRTTSDPLYLLNKFFSGYTAFYPEPKDADGTSLQEMIVRHAFNNKPLLAILPTGGGKSLCYQLPALVGHLKRGLLTVVISPLQALMKDQVDNLIKKTGTFSVAAINGLLTLPERRVVIEKLQEGDIALLYISPEQLRNNSIVNAIKQREIGSWVFDEAHCFSKWGHDFRPDYLYVSRCIRLIAQAQNTTVPVIACFTATAKKEVVNEILYHFKSELNQDLTLFSGGVDRPKLIFSVKRVRRNEKFSAIEAILIDHLKKNCHESIVIYVSKRKHAEMLAEFLKSKNFNAAGFHAGLNASEKKDIQNKFYLGQIQIICATNAFGMGIDKSDIRLVIHADIPGSLENYLQEAGRAGRDHNEATCILLYDENDVEFQFKLSVQSELSKSDITEILRVIRRKTKNRSQEIIVTPKELLRTEDIQIDFDSRDFDSETKVKAAICWLEKSGFLERNQNLTHIFQGKPLVKTMLEAEKIISCLSITEREKINWLSVMRALINAPKDSGLSADEIAFIPVEANSNNLCSDSTMQSESMQVMRQLENMGKQGLIKSGTLLSAFVRTSGVKSSKHVFEKITALEKELIVLLKQNQPDIDPEEWYHINLQSLNTSLSDAGHATTPELLLQLLKHISSDFQTTGQKAAFLLRHQVRNLYLVKIQSSWQSVSDTTAVRRALTKRFLMLILSKVPQTSMNESTCLVEFSYEELSESVSTDLIFRDQIKDIVSEINKALLYLHDNHVIVLQKGLAIFRQAMTLKLVPEYRKKAYTSKEYRGLSQHYKERIFQIHVMNEFASIGIERISHAMNMVKHYFVMTKNEFVARYFKDRIDSLDYATSQKSLHNIVFSLKNTAQISIVKSSLDENMLILAGPGSGKTRVVTHRCAYLLRIKQVKARSIIVLCYNHNAAVKIRKDLNTLIGPDSRLVAVVTYHGLSMRLTGRTFVQQTEINKSSQIDFKGIIQHATALLQGSIEIAGIEPDELRERLLSGYEYILVDEYQDIDQDQYALVSSLTGRTLLDTEKKMAILAVGDDDQNIYAFRGAHVGFIKKFENDYKAKIHYLTENYRSTKNIIDCSNYVISFNREREKKDKPIRINTTRNADAPGGIWETLDTVHRGKVVIHRTANHLQQVHAVIDDVKRKRALKTDGNWEGFAILGRTKRHLSAVRTLLEKNAIPFVWTIDQEILPPLHRIREVSQYISRLTTLTNKMVSLQELDIFFQGIVHNGSLNPWNTILNDHRHFLRDEYGETEIPLDLIKEALYEQLSQVRHDNRVGHGIWVSTVHAVKGLEFEHVYVLDGDWQIKHQSSAEEEEQRRLYYVAMTRAKETLTLFQRQDCSNPFVPSITGDFCTIQTSQTSSTVASDGSDDLEYAQLGMKDLFLDYLSLFSCNSREYQTLSKLECGDRITLRVSHKTIDLVSDTGVVIGKLSQKAYSEWKNKVDRIEHVTIIALIERRRDDCAAFFEHTTQCDQWEVPLIEIAYHP